MSRIDVFLLVPSALNFWPLTRQHLLDKTIMGKKVINYFLDSLLTDLDVRRIVFLYENEKPAEETISRYGVDIVFRRVNLADLANIWDIIGSISTEDTILVSYIFNLALLDKNFLRRIHVTKNRIYVTKENFLVFYFGRRGEWNQAEVISTQFEAIFYSWDVYRLFSILLKSIEKPKISKSIRKGYGVKIIGNCIIEDNVAIYENAVIKGPCYIGRNSIIGNNAVIRESIIGENSIIGANMEVARSWLGDKTETHSGYIGDSIFDRRVHTGAGFITANVRLDRKTIRVKFKGRKIDTGLPKLGAIVGQHTEIGIHVGTMPGVLIGNNVFIGPGTLIFDNVEDNMRVYVVQEIIKKGKNFE